MDNACNMHMLSPKSIIVKYDDGSNIQELIDFIYQESKLDCTVEIQLPYVSMKIPVHNQKSQKVAFVNENVAKKKTLKVA
jgi:hypothetical protein